MEEIKVLIVVLIILVSVLIAFDIVKIEEIRETRRKLGKVLYIFQKLENFHNKEDEL